MYYIGRIIGAFFNQFFRWLFWNKTGQKLLFSILIVVIFFVFIKCGEVAAVEDVSDVNYEVYANYDNIMNDLILRLGNAARGDYQSLMSILTNGGYDFYLYYGNTDSTSYNGGYPQNKYSLYLVYWSKGSTITKTQSNYDYMGITGQTQYLFNISNASQYGRYRLNGNYVDKVGDLQNFYMPLCLYAYYNTNYTDFIFYYANNKDAEMVQLLEDIKSSLTDTEPTSETDSFVSVDTSSTDSISSTAVDNVASNVLSNLESKVNNYNPSTDYSFVWNIMGTTITFHSNMIYNLIKDTFLYDLIQMLWFFITGHYCFAFLSNLIHSIKDGSILDGFHPNEVISKEVL